MTTPKTPPNGLAVLSMHQPWASLLVYGLKRIEGRSWPTEYRGKLWIHSTSKQATQHEIQVLIMRLICADLDTKLYP